ncbi:cupredoxin domain-containing protein [Paenibacillus sp. LHD-117]|uniref:cupredoxin domain-containing protein n=1 Tax=Paenibacillus sp. LHD-117 TaxID=3071412 RepID=UPI0027E10EF7|nr:cupredoxin domain-containing protein [Paenibacillus sp. LHD-117]MDQ6422944.1 cupredoxin domain-containing protein [Paenibacillus sp. LHD-117]
MLLKKKFFRVLLVFILVVASILAVYWYQNSVTSVNKNSQRDKNGVYVEVLLTEWKITPKNFNVNRGETVYLSVLNQGSYPHDFAIKELGIKTRTLAPGEKETLTFVAEQPVTLESYCSLPGHKESGMETQLLIK